MLWINAFHQQFCPTPKLSEYALTGNEKTMIVFVVFCVAFFTGKRMWLDIKRWFS